MQTTKIQRTLVAHATAGLTDGTNRLRRADAHSSCERGSTALGLNTSGTGNRCTLTRRGVRTDRTASPESATKLVPSGETTEIPIKGPRLHATRRRQTRRGPSPRRPLGSPPLPAPGLTLGKSPREVRGPTPATPPRRIPGP